MNPYLKHKQVLQVNKTTYRKMSKRWKQAVHTEDVSWLLDWWKYVPSLKTLGKCNSNKISLTQPHAESDSYKGHHSMCWWEYGALKLINATRGKVSWYKNRGSCLEAIPFLELALEVGLAHRPGDMDKNRYRSMTGISAKHLTLQVDE